MKNTKNKSKTATIAVILISTIVASIITCTCVPFAIASVGPLQIVDTIRLDKEPVCIAVNEVTNRVYIGVEGGLLVIDCDSYDVAADVTLDAEVIGLAINPKINRIYAVVYGENVSVIDCATNQVVGELPETIHDSSSGVGIAVNPFTSLVYVEDRTATMGKYDKINVYSGETNLLVTSLNITESSTHSYIEELGLAVNPETNRIYVTWSGENTLHMFDGNTHEFMESVSPSSFSEEVMVNPYTNYVYVGDVVLDGETLGEVISDYQGDLKAIDPVNNLLYTTDYNTLYVLDGTTHDVLTSLEVDWGVSAYSDPVAVNCETGKCYVVDTSANQIPVVIPEFSTWTSILFVLFVFVVAIFVYRRIRCQHVMPIKN